MFPAVWITLVQRLTRHNVNKAICFSNQNLKANIFVSCPCAPSFSLFACRFLYFCHYYDVMGARHAFVLPRMQKKKESGRKRWFYHWQKKISASGEIAAHQNKTRAWVSVGLRPSSAELSKSNKNFLFSFFYVSPNIKTEKILSEFFHKVRSPQLYEWLQGYNPKTKPLTRTWILPHIMNTRQHSVIDLGDK